MGAGACCEASTDGVGVAQLQSHIHGGTSGEDMAGVAQTFRSMTPAAWREMEQIVSRFVSRRSCARRDCNIHCCAVAGDDAAAEALLLQPHFVQKVTGVITGHVVCRRMKRKGRLAASHELDDHPRLNLTAG